MNPHTLRRRAAFAALCLSLIVSSAHAQPPGTTTAGVIDLATGPDVFFPYLLAVNPATNRLYVSGGPASSDQNQGIKVIGTATKQIIGGIDLGRYASVPSSDTYLPNVFLQFGMAVDSSAAPRGNKVYALGQLKGPKFVLRVIDGETNQNLTGEGTDLVLPRMNQEQQLIPPATIVVNPANHKIYISDGYGKIIVVAGGAEPKIIGELNPNAGNFLVLSPAANKVFVMGHNVNGQGSPGAVIDSTTDTFKPISIAMPNVSAAVFNPANNRLYFSGRVDRRWGIFVLDGTTGELVMENTQDGITGGCLAIAPSRNALFANGDEYAADDLSFRRNIGPPMHRAATYVEGGDDLFFIPESPHAVAAVDLASMESTRITVGHRPWGMAANSRTDRVYVTDSEAEELVVLQASSGDVAARVARPPSPYILGNPAIAPRPVAVSERLNRVYVTRSGINGEEMIIDVLDGESHQVRSSIVIARGQAGLPIVIDDTRRRIYVGIVERGPTSFPTDRVKVAVYDADTEALIETLAVRDRRLGARLQNIAVNPVLGRLYVVDEGSITTIDTTTNFIVASQPARTYSGIAVNKRTGKVFAGVSRSGLNSTAQPADTRILVMNGLTGALEAEFAPPAGDYLAMHTLAVDEVTNRLYAAQGLPAANEYESKQYRITAYDGDTYELLGEHISRDAKNMLFEPASRKLFVVDEKHGTIGMFQSTTAAEPDLLGNISTRGNVSAGDGSLIGGFIVKGAPGSTTKVIVRAIGPSMQPLGVQGTLANTTLELHTAAGAVIVNDDWKINAATGESQQSEIEATGLAPSNDLEAAIVAELPAGAHTAVIRGQDGAVGVGLAEVFVLDASSGAQLANIATRGQVGTGENVMIGGLIVTGSTASRVLVRAIGPSLSEQLSGALGDPVLELYDINGGLIATNDDWKQHEAEIAATTIPPTDDRESAMVTTLHPGNYTAIVRGSGETTGVALVEAYRLP